MNYARAIVVDMPFTQLSDVEMRRSRDPDANGNIDIVVKSHSDGGDHPQTTDVRTLTVLFLSLLLDLLGFTVILPLFPTILDYYGQHDDQVFI
jgi:hypothetical protein